MFIGHFGLGLASKKISSKPSLGTYFIAAQFIDLLWPVLLLLGIEQVEINPGNTALTPLNFLYYPFSHSFLGVLIWAILFGGIYYFLKKNMRVSIILGALVLSHWVLDIIVHRPDLPIFPWSELKVGFGLWNSVILSIIVEGAIFFTGVFVYNSVTKAINKSGMYGYWALIAFLVVVYVMNVFGTPPPETEPIAYVGLSQWLLVGWAYWVDKNRIDIT